MKPSTRYEKGMSATSTLSALAQSAELLISIASAEVASTPIDVYLQPEMPQVIAFDLSAVKRLTGVEISKSEIVSKPGVFRV